MNTIEENLKHYREKQNLTIEALATKTKISLNHLRKLEAGDFASFKGDEPYVKMYLKRIAKELNVDENLFLNIYVEWLQVQSIVQEVEEEKKPKIKVKKTKLPKKVKPTKRVYGNSSSKKILKYVAVLIMVAFVIYGVWYGIFYTLVSDQTPDYIPPQIGSVEKDEELEAKLEAERLEAERLEQERIEAEQAALLNPVEIIEGDNAYFKAINMNVDEEVVLRVEFNQPSAFNLWTKGNAVAGAYRASYNEGEVYEYKQSFVEGQTFTINLWNLNDVKIYINDKEVVYNKDTVPFTSGAYFINVTTIGAINESTEQTNNN